MTKIAYKQKGSTLVEVLVALSVFLIVIGTLVAGYFSVKKVVLKQKEFVYFEAICDDIAKYGDLYGKSWDEKYFADGIVHKFDSSGNEIDDSGIGTITSWVVFYNSDFEPVSSESKYRLSYRYDADALVVNIENIVSNYFIIENLDYGDKRYTSVNSAVILPTLADIIGLDWGSANG